MILFFIGMCNSEIETIRTIFTERLRYYFTYEYNSGILTIIICYRTIKIIFYVSIRNYFSKNTII